MSKVEQHASRAIRRLDWASLLSYAALLGWLDAAPRAGGPPPALVRADRRAPRLPGGRPGLGGGALGGGHLGVTGPARGGPCRCSSRSASTTAIRWPSPATTSSRPTGTTASSACRCWGSAVWLVPGTDRSGSLFLSAFLGGAGLLGAAHQPVPQVGAPAGAAPVPRVPAALASDPPAGAPRAPPQPALQLALLHHHRVAELAPELGTLLPGARVVHHRVHGALPRRDDLGRPWPSRSWPRPSPSPGPSPRSAA